ncbi:MULTISPECIES: DUF4202 domain-containing protein [unclassified Methylocaldum]|jgi:hypothetical protein|uniref:DUF4202 domain-containing protein n=1 Tax=unclassified Methylocaldum TaxID=2622260 RepID=UPI000989FAA1|nr:MULTISPECIES: DUF4202 domain-containing protein [unclassified Methylocaldum]MBP1151698.1 hypothetical protein [Methylocaldum sp. RMAD-M]
MNEDRLDRVLVLIDEANAQDPNSEVWRGESYPKELLYGMRMTEWLDRLYPDAPDLLHIAARGQHIRRWEVPRQTYPDTREGYLQWRSYLYGFHADCVAQLMTQAGYDPIDIERVRKVLQKRGLKNDPDVQSIEDVACLVFLDYYFVAFAAIHDEEKLIGIVRKTWKKMSEHARSRALELEFPESVRALLATALEAV